jgi:hypothetical protein
MSGTITVRSTIGILRLVAEAEIQADQAKITAALIRQGVEKRVWNERETNPNLDRPLVELEMTPVAAALIPKKIKTVRDFCANYSLADLAQLGMKREYAREIQDLLRAWGLVLKPQD